MRHRAPVNVLHNNTQSPPDCPCTCVLALLPQGDGETSTERLRLPPAATAPVWSTTKVEHAFADCVSPYCN